eukprot:1389750-Amorphochlora_amoeboformis.AAC.2
MNDEAYYPSQPKTMIPNPMYSCSCHWAAVNIRKNLAEGRIKPPLLRILAYDETLRLFREHLVKEWAIENLMFYEAVVAAQVQRNSYSSARSLEKLQRIYFKYIHAEAEFMVNLSAPVANPLHKLFKNPRLLAVLKRHAMHKSKQKTTSKIDMLKVGSVDIYLNQSQTQL